MVLLPQPFKLTRVGPVNLFVDDDEALKRWQTDPKFYIDRRNSVARRTVRLLALRQQSSFARHLPQIMAQKIGLSEATSNMSFGLQLANYQQLKSAVNLLRGNGVRVKTEIIPPELNTSIDYAAYAFDHDGDCLKLLLHGAGGLGRTAASERDAPLSRST